MADITGRVYVTRELLMLSVIYHESSQKVTH